MNKVKSIDISLGLMFFLCFSYGFVYLVLEPMAYADIFGMGGTYALISSVYEPFSVCVGFLIVACLLLLNDVPEDVRDMWRAVIEFVMEHQQDEEEDHQLEETKEEVLKEETEQEQVKGLADEPIVL